MTEKPTPYLYRWSVEMAEAVEKYRGDMRAKTTKEALDSLLSQALAVRQVKGKFDAAKAYALRAISERAEAPDPLRVLGAPAKSVGKAADALPLGPVPRKPGAGLKQTKGKKT